MVYNDLIILSKALKRLTNLGGTVMAIVNLDKERLAECRKKLGITKQEAAKRMQMSQPAYLRYEAGDRHPSIHVIQTMADVLGTSVAYLTGKSKNSSPDLYIVRSDEDPELFHVVDQYKKNNPDAIKRIKAYAKK